MTIWDAIKNAGAGIENGYHNLNDVNENVFGESDGREWRDGAWYKTNDGKNVFGQYMLDGTDSPNAGNYADRNDPAANFLVRSFADIGKKVHGLPAAGAKAQDEADGGGGLLGALGLGDKFGSFLDSLGTKMQAGQDRASDPMAGLGKMPSANVPTLAQLMTDGALQNVADQQIMAQNAAIMRQNADRGRDMNRDLGARQSVGDHASQQVQQIAHQHDVAQGAIQKRQNIEQEKSQTNVNDILQNVALNMISDDNVRSGMQAEQGKALQERTDAAAANDQMLNDVGASGADALAQIAAAEPMQTQADMSSIRNAAHDDIATNSQKARDNWGQRSEILAQLAAQEQSAAQARAGLAMDAYKTKAGILSGNADRMLQQSQYDSQALTAQAKANGSGGTSFIDFSKMWHQAANRPAGPAIKTIGKEGDEMTYQPTFSDTWDQKTLDYYNQHAADGTLMLPPPIYRGQQPASKKG